MTSVLEQAGLLLPQPLRRRPPGASQPPRPLNNDRMTAGLRERSSDRGGWPRRRTTADRVRLAFDVLGELLITFGVVVLLFAAYELKITDWQTASTQRGLASDLER